MVQPKVRGRRAEKKSKEVTTQSEDYTRSDKSEVKGNDGEVELNPALKTTFFGLVDSNEIDYFKQAESTLNVNAFDNDEEREGFIRSVLEEARGKELKLVTNQICSKLMERLVLFATDRQLKNIFRQFSGHFVALAHHKYSSHVLETLLVRAAALIEKELVNDFKQDEGDVNDEISQEQDREDEAVVSMETLFIKMLDEFNPHLKTMVDHQYSSHVLRLLILIIAGKELPSTTTSNSTLRSKKSKIARKMIEIKDNDDFNRSFQTPPSFKDQLRKICNSLSSKGDMKHMRELAINKVASPVMQLLIQVEGIVDKERTFWHLIFLNESSDKNPQEEAFVEYLLSDSVGSHFLESVIRNGGARMKYIERLYKLYMKDRVLKLSKRSTTGVFIIQALLFKLKPVEVTYILDQIIPELASLISIDENQNLELGKNIIDASISRDNYRREELIGQLFVKFAPNYDRNNPSADTSSEFLENTLHLTGSTLGNTRDDWPTAEERRRSLFLEKLMEYDHSFVVCTWLNFLALPIARFIQMCYHGVFSHVVENSLVVIPASEGEPKNVLIIRKRFLNLFQNEIVNLACNSYGSHIVDRLWNFTVLLNMYKDRIGSELASDSHKVKESTYGRLVWKNWSMELFVRKKYDWKLLIKNQEEEYFGFGDNKDQNNTERVKKPIELKFEQMMREKQAKEERAQKAEEGFNKRKNNEFDYGYNDDNKKAKIRGRNR
ncbi:Nucleolar protein 9 [Debaryomyces fabryi]|uniref:Nucleolar protein 9 n=1 Tax=Debaryomyces fabryi TaxID=58627 RepID=A0A0V1PV69_9ASCO|nr:Nucleolar protein 9 [Debaryomyces fabryi]KSA00151.1 Nucleolar protein 9 [Debaryomyces fabryi]CUM47836.1 unnamed protein product [Debaryomyces fabryi]